MPAKNPASPAGGPEEIWPRPQAEMDMGLKVMPASPEELRASRGGPQHAGSDSHDGEVSPHVLQQVINGARRDTDDL